MQAVEQFSCFEVKMDEIVVWPSDVLLDLVRCSGAGCWQTQAPAQWMGLLLQVRYFGCVTSYKLISCRSVAVSDTPSASSSKLLGNWREFCKRQCEIVPVWPREAHARVSSSNHSGLTYPFFLTRSSIVISLSKYETEDTPCQILISLDHAESRKLSFCTAGAC